MAIGKHLEDLGGHKLIDWTPGTKLNNKEAPRLRIDEGGLDEWVALLEQLAGSEYAATLEALSVGSWSDELFDENSGPVVEALVKNAKSFPKLQHLFVGDITYEECEISWLQQGDMGPLFSAFPELRSFGVRGGGVSFSTLAHDKLTKFVVQAGGLSKGAVNEIAKADLPALEHFELWLGTDNYGGDSSVEDITPFLSGQMFPKLVTLALRNCDYTDNIAIAAANAPVLATIKHLDLSMGTLGDKGAQALLQSPYLSKLESVNILHNYATGGVLAELSAKLGSKLIYDEGLEPDEYDGAEYRYVECGE